MPVFADTRCNIKVQVLKMMVDYIKSLISGYNKRINGYQRCTNCYIEYMIYDGWDFLIHCHKCKITRNAGTMCYYKLTPAFEALI